MLSPRWLIGITMIMVCFFVLANWVDGSPMMTSEQGNIVTNMTGHQVVSVTNPSTGGEVNYINVALGTLGLIGKALLWDYTFFYDNDPVTGLDANTDLGVFLKLLQFFLIAISVGIIFQMAYLLRQIIAG
jgi:hypothetical protein